MEPLTIAHHTWCLCIFCWVFVLSSHDMSTHRVLSTKKTNFTCSFIWVRVMIIAIPCQSLEVAQGGSELLKSIRVLQTPEPNFWKCQDPWLADYQHCLYASHHARIHLATLIQLQLFAVLISCIRLQSSYPLRYSSSFLHFLVHSRPRKTKDWLATLIHVQFSEFCSVPTITGRKC